MSEREYASPLDDALVQLVTAAMLSGYWCISERKEAAKQHYYDHPDCSGADMLRAALRDFPIEFLRTRRDLVDPVVAAVRGEEGGDG